MNNYRDILAGLFGGAVSAILLIVANMGGVMAIFLFLLVTFPIYIVTLGWGTRTGLAATLAAFVILASATTGKDAISFTLMFFSIAAVLGHQANLAQQNPQHPDQLVWYPLSRLLFNLTAMIVIGIVVAGFVNDYSPARLEAAYLELLQHAVGLSSNNDLLAPEDLKEMARLYASMMPFVLPSLLIVIHVANLYLAASITRRSGQFFRPGGNIPATLNLPMPAVGAMVAGLAGMMILSGVAGQIFAVISGAYVTALALVGLASLHFSLRNNAASVVILFLAYAACFVFLLPFYFFAINGTIRVFARTSSAVNNNPENDAS